jgi:hypothetical protein
MRSSVSTLLIFEIQAGVWRAAAHTDNLDHNKKAGCLKSFETALGSDGFIRAIFSA